MNEARHTELQRKGAWRNEEEDKEHYALFKTKASILKPGSACGTYAAAMKALQVPQQNKKYASASVLPGVTVWTQQNEARLTELQRKRHRRNEEEDKEHYALFKTKAMLDT